MNTGVETNRNPIRIRHSFKGSLLADFGQESLIYLAAGLARGSVNIL